VTCGIRPRCGRRIDCVPDASEFYFAGAADRHHLVAGFFAYIHSIKRQTYLLLWTPLAVFALHYMGPAIAPWAAASPQQSALNHWLFALSGVLFFWSTSFTRSKKTWKIAGLIASVLFGLWPRPTPPMRFPFPYSSPLLCCTSPSRCVLAGKPAAGDARRPPAGCFLRFLGSSVDCALCPERTPELQGAGMSVVAAAPCAFVAMLMVMALYEEEKRRIERNMLALSNLNLATSSFVGGEIQRCCRKLWTACWALCACGRALFLHQRRSPRADFRRRRGLE